MSVTGRLRAAKDHLRDRGVRRHLSDSVNPNDPDEDDLERYGSDDALDSRRFNATWDGG